MSFFDFEEFNELKAEAKKKEAPRKKKEEKQKKKSAPKTVYKLPLTLKSIAGDLVMTEGTGTEEEVKQFLAEQDTLYLTDVLLESFDGSLLLGNFVKKLLHSLTAGIVKIVVIIGLADLQIKLVNCSLLGRDLEVSLYNICTKLSLFAYSLACIVDSFCKFFKHDFFLLLIWLCFRKPQTVLNAFCIASLCWLSCYVLSITHKSSYVNRLQRFLIFVNHFLIFF